jgi:epoxyqueuosine reductase
MTVIEEIKQKALKLGFDLVGVTDTSTIEADYFSMWLDKGFAASLNYMRNNLDKRFNPAGLLPNAQSVIVTGLNYKPPISDIPVTVEQIGKVAAYAQYEDYHSFIKNLLYKLAEFITENAQEKPNFKFCVDSVPLAERPLAVRAGLGFIGKNHVLINPKLGTQILLGEIITDFKLDVDEPAAGGCLDCDKCLKACPTGALRDDGFFDAGRCISYLTIEHKGDIPDELAKKIGDHLFGCDKCVIACPYQKDAPACKNKNFKFYPERARLNLNDILEMNEDEFDTQFADSPIHRPGMEKLKQNAKICLRNTSDYRG